MTTANGKHLGFDTLENLQQRLETTRAHKETTQKQINQCNEELQRLFTKAPKKPKETVAELTEKINKLEFKRTTTSWTLPEERAILKDMHIIQKLKIAVEEYHSHDRKIQEKKTELSNLRDDFKVTLATLDELDIAYQKVKLANKLGCSPEELTTHSMECQPDKVGRVIGKQGATIKLLEQNHKVAMDVDSVAAKINLTGSANAIASAVMEIDKIMKSVDLDVLMDKHVLNYLTSKRVTALTDLRNAHSGITIEAIRDKKQVQLRGLPEEVAAAKVALLMLDLISKTKHLAGREYSIIVGKAGVTINKFVDDHQVNIDVDEVGEEEWEATITGPPNNVQKCWEDVEHVLAMNKDVVVSLQVDSMSRNILLSDSGAPIKKLQADINEKVKAMGGGAMVQITFDKQQTSENKETMLIKGRFSAVAVAKEMVQEMIFKMKQSLVSIAIDPFVISRIIGKGGETIKKIRNGKSVNIDVDKDAGRIMVQSHDEAEVKRVEAEIKTIISENQLVRINFQPEVVKTMFRELSRSEQKAVLAELVWMGVDEETDQFVLRGTRENLEKATLIVNNYIAEHYIQEIDISAEDEPTLLVGGSESTITKLATELDVILSINRARYVLTLKGEKDKVEAAVKRVNQFLYGGDGHTVSRIAVSEQALGVVIGKGGSKRTELEKKYEGVSLFIHKSNRIAIRGPEATVDACRIEILKLVSSVKIQQVMEITPEQHAILSKPDVVRRATNGIPVQVLLTEDSVKIRGLFPDVRDAQAMLKEPMLGFYEARVELDPSQLACVKGACRNPGHFKRMEELTNAKVGLDLSMNAIIVSGKRSDVKRAKSLVIEFIDFLLPADFAHLKISKPLYSTVGDASALADISAVSGASVTFDRDTSSIEVQSSDPGKVKNAADLLRAKIAEAEKLAFVITLAQSDAWLIPLIIGKGGNRVNAFRMDVNCQVDVNKEDRSLTVSGENEADVTRAKLELNKIIDSARRECFFTVLPSAAIASFVGRSGAHIKNFATENNVEIERMRKEPNKFKITGEEKNVEAAKDAMSLWIASWEQQSAAVSISIDKSLVSAIIGKGGENIQSIQKEFNCKVEVNRDDMIVTVRGGSDEIREKAMEKINQIIAESKAASAVRSSERQEVKEKSDEQPIGDSPKQSQPKNAIGVLDTRKDRSTEFAARPIGLTIDEKPKKKRVRNKTKVQGAVNDSTLKVESAAGQTLFKLLFTEESNPNVVSDTAPAVTDGAKNRHKDHRNGSTGIAVKENDDEQNGFVRVNSKNYSKSASGVTVKV